MSSQRVILTCISTLILFCLSAQAARAVDFNFSWLPNNESNVAGYRVYYGLSSGVYNLDDYTEVDAEPDPETGRVLGTIPGLDEKEVYYFAVTAFNDDYVESDFSTEIVYRTDCPITGMPPLERGEISVNNEWTDIKLQQTFAHPIVVASITSNNEPEPVVVRIDEVTTDGFKIRIQGFGVPDDTRDQETVSYVVMEEGTYALTDGTLIEAGTFTTYGTNSFYPQTFKRNFNTPPVLMAAISSYNDYEAVTGRINNLDTIGFDYMMQEQEANMDGHATEVISYIAWEPSDGTVNGMSFSVGRTGETITPSISNIIYPAQNRADFQRPPVIVTNMVTTNGTNPAVVRCLKNNTTGIDIKIQEEQSIDDETEHNPEAVGYITLSNMTLPPLEAGEVKLDHTWVRVNFAFKYYKPVVVARIMSFNGSDPAVTRIKDVDHTGFSIKIQEWVDDGWHTQENVSYIAMEEGSYILPDGTHIEAGILPNDIHIEPGANTAFTADAFAQQSFKQNFSVPPVVMTSITSDNDNETVSGRQRNIHEDGFEYMMQEQQASSDGHTTETVSYIAWEPSNNTVDGMIYNVNKGKQIDHTFARYYYDTQSPHTFQDAPVVLVDMQTFNGWNTAAPRCRNNNASGIEIKIEEEQSFDSEVIHNLEGIGYIALSSQDTIK